MFVQSILWKRSWLYKCLYKAFYGRELYNWQHLLTLQTSLVIPGFISGYRYQCQKSSQSVILKRSHDPTFHTLTENVGFKYDTNNMMELPQFLLFISNPPSSIIGRNNGNLAWCISIVRLNKSGLKLTRV
jgi:hypothetical protein